MVFCERRDRDPEPTGVGRRSLGCRDADHPESIGETRGKPFDDKGGGRARAEPDDHSVPNLLDRTQSRGALQLITIDAHESELRMAAIARA